MTRRIGQYWDLRMTDNKTGLLRERVVSIDALRGFDMFFLIGGFAIIRAVCDWDSQLQRHRGLATDGWIGMIENCAYFQELPDEPK